MLGKASGRAAQPRVPKKAPLVLDKAGRDGACCREAF
jgi:hypothetical protein